VYDERNNQETAGAMFFAMNNSNSTNAGAHFIIAKKIAAACWDCLEFFLGRFGLVLVWAATKIVQIFKRIFLVSYFSQY
jgi:hypothetical protein